MKQSSWRLGLTVGAVLIAIVAANLAVWSLLNQPRMAAEWDQPIRAVSYSPYREGQSPIQKIHPTREQMAEDMQVLAKVTRAVRTYSVLDGLDQVPDLAHAQGLNVILGAWLDKDTKRNEAEIAKLMELRDKPNVTHIIVGNETLLRGDVTEEQLIDYIRRVKEATRGRIPVSTADTWVVYMQHPKLAEEVDFIAAHFLPYWEGIPFANALDQVKSAYGELDRKYGRLSKLQKPIMMAEVGWPSLGPWVRGAEPSPGNQAAFVRSFLNFANAERLNYTIMEAFDQPWKHVLEGPAGVSWGVIDKDRQAKFPLTGVILENRDWPKLATVSVLLALPALIFFLMRRRRDLRPAGLLFYGLLIQSCASLFVYSTVNVTTNAIIPTLEIAWSILIVLQVILFFVVLSDGFEFTEAMFRGVWPRSVNPLRGSTSTAGPKVSIHVPCYNEPPDMVIETLNALARLHYQNYEVLLIDNNTRDPEVWRPVEAHCANLGPRFRFFHLDKWPGYKAGALNFGLKMTDPEAEIVAVIDSDYCVAPDWLSAMVPYFDDPKVGLIQSPQDYRDWEDEPFKTMINWEYAGFFNIGMMTRNERNAIIQHGTMTMVRHVALRDADGWAEWCITEDSELGLTLFERGWQAVYSPESFGKGLVPDSFSAYKTQRFRWAYGAMQIVKKHWRSLLPGSKKLTGAQKYHFTAGWLPWFADGVHLLFSIASIFWSVGLLVAGVITIDNFKWLGDNMAYEVEQARRLATSIFGFPPVGLLIPTVLAFVFKVCVGFWVYAKRVRCGPWERLGAAIAGMALTYTVGRAVLQGLATSGRPFVRTPKMEGKPALTQGFMMAKGELILAVLLLASGGAVVWAAGMQNQEATLWALMLAVQSLPFWAAVITSFINAKPSLVPGFARRRRRAAAAMQANPAA